MPAKNHKPPKQELMKGVIPPLTAVQEAALTYVEAKDEARRASDRVKDRKDDMIKSAIKHGVLEIKVHDASGMLHILDFTNEIKVKQTSVVDIKIEKQEKEPAAA